VSPVESCQYCTPTTGIHTHECSAFDHQDCEHTRFVGVLFELREWRERAERVEARVAELEWQLAALKEAWHAEINEIRTRLYAGEAMR